MVAQRLDAVIPHTVYTMNHIAPGGMLKQHHVAAQERPREGNNTDSVRPAANQWPHAVAVQGNAHGQHRTALAERVPLGNGEVSFFHDLRHEPFVPSSPMSFRPRDTSRSA